MLPTLPCVLWLLALLLPGSACAEQRFPPPEFETNYQLPVTQVPAPRALAWQYVDVGVLIAGLAVATYLAHRNRSRRGMIGLSLFSIAYFGFYREGCICPIGSPQNVMLALCDPNYVLPATVLLFFLVPIVVSLFAGRTFCAGVCPHGALQDLVLVRPILVPRWLEEGLLLIPFLFLGAGLALASTGAAFVICRYDPFVPLFRLTGSLALLVTGGLFVLASLFIGRPYCRFLCPYGALLRLAALASKWRVRITPDDCTQCRLCEQSCPFGAIREPTSADPPTPPSASDRRRLGWALVLLPCLLLTGAWIGPSLGLATARFHPEIALAESLAHPNRPPIPPGPPTPDTLALARGEQDLPGLITRAVDLRMRFHRAGLWFGLWTGLVLGTRWITLCWQTPRTEFEPDRGACIACARCFRSCPNERVRLGLLPASALPPRTPDPSSASPPTPALPLRTHPHGQGTGETCAPPSRT